MIKTRRKPIILPTWAQCNLALHTGQADSLQHFIREYEPLTGEHSAALFRKQLAEVLRQVQTGKSFDSQKPPITRCPTHWLITYRDGTVPMSRHSLRTGSESPLTDEEKVIDALCKFIVQGVYP